MLFSFLLVYVSPLDFSLLHGAFAYCRIWRISQRRALGVSIWTSLSQIIQNPFGFWSVITFLSFFISLHKFYGYFRLTYSDLCNQIPESKFRGCLLATLAVLFKLMCSYHAIMSFLLEDKVNICCPDCYSSILVCYLWKCYH